MAGRKKKAKKSSAAAKRAAKEKFARGILSRGEAVPKGAPLSPGATHEVTATDSSGGPVLKRRRFSLR